VEQISGQHVKWLDIQRAQFPLDVKLADGTMVQKPASW
jgi:hypothetical protein